MNNSPQYGFCIYQYHLEEVIFTSKENEENIANNINNKLTESNIFTTNQTASSINKISNEEQKDINVDLNTFRPGKGLRKVVF
jgi:hypothetical protein